MREIEGGRATWDENVAWRQVKTSLRVPMSTHKSTKGKRGGHIVLPTDHASLVRFADLLKLRCSLAARERAPAQSPLRFASGPRLDANRGVTISALRAPSQAWTAAGACQRAIDGSLDAARRRPILPQARPR